MQSRVIFVCLLLNVCLFSCDSKSVFDEYKTVPDVWPKNEIIDFKISAPDSINTYNLFVNLRNTNGYKYSNLFLVVEMEYPNGRTNKDTLEYKMAKPNGELLGTGLTSIKENKLWYKGYLKPFSFNESGEYIIKIQHAMRENGEVKGIDNLEGVTDIGFRVEKQNN